MDDIAENVIYELWITFSEKILKRISDVLVLTADQEDALRRVMLRPNDFIIKITNTDKEAD